MGKTQTLFFISLIFIVLSINAQEKETKTTSLKEVLFEIENIHQIKFSYSDNLLINKYIDIDLKDKSLKEILEELQSKTQFIFQKVTKRYIVISNKNQHAKNLVCGLLIDAKTNKPVEGVSVSSSIKNTGSISDNSGYFQLAAIQENDTLNIRFIGYKSIKISAKELFKKPCKTIYLAELISLLDEITITNYLTNGISKNKNGSISVSTKKLGILPGLTEPDVLQSIQLLPGINSPNETVSGIHIRGGTPDQNLILFDGIKMYNSAHFFGMISAFNPYITENIKVFRSGAGAKYGNHISGVIDLETNDDLAIKPSGGFGFNLTHTDAFVKLKLKENLSFSFSIRRSFKDIFNTNTFKKLSEKVFQNTVISLDNNLNNDDFSTSTDFHFLDFNSKIIYEPNNKNKLVFNQLYVENKLEHLFGAKNKSYNTSDVLKVKNKGFSGKWIRNWNNNITQKTSFYFSDYDFNYQFNENSPFENESQKGVKLNKIEDFNFQTLIEIEKNKRSSFNLGYQFSNNNVSYKLERADTSQPNFDTLLEEANKNLTHAFFGEYIYQNNNKFSLQIGARTNYFTLTEKLFFAPRVYTELLLSSNFWIKGSLESKQQNISQLLEFTTSDFGLENQVWALSTNEDIPILKSNQYTFGFLFKKDKWVVDLDFYKKQITGLTSISKGFQTVNKDYSEGKSNVFGVDFLVQKRWRNYGSWLSYSFSDIDFTFPDINNSNSFSGNTDIQHNLLWSHNLKLGNYNFSLGWNIRTGIPYTNALKIDANNDISYQNELNGSRLPTYHKLDFSSTYSFYFNEDKNWKGKLGLSFINIYNRKNILQRNFSVEQDENNVSKLLKNDIYSLGFTPNIVFRVDF